MTEGACRVFSTELLEGVPLVILPDGQSAVYAADGRSRASGEPALAVAFGIAGALEAASALLTAWGDKSRIALLTVVDARDFGIVYGACSAVARACVHFGPGESVANGIEKAAAALAERGPVHLAVSDRAQAAAVARELFQSRSLATLSPEGGRENKPLAEAFTLLRGLRRPAILLGRGGASAAEPGLVVELAREWGSPVLLTAGATTMPPALLARWKAAFSSDAPAAALVPSGNLAWLKTLGGSDGILALGAGLSETDGFGLREFPAYRGRIVQAGIEDPATRVCDLFLKMDAGAAARAWLDELKRGPARVSPRWPRRCAGLARRWREFAEAEARRCSSLPRIEPQFAAWSIARAAPENAIFFSEGGACGMWLWSYLWLRPFVFPSQDGTLGVPVPMAIGAAGSGAPLWCVMGDGAFFYAAKDLRAAARAGLPLVCFVFNDGSWSSIRLAQTFLFGNRYVGTDLPAVDYAGLAEAYGCEGAAVRQPEELAAALERAKSRGGALPPLVVDIGLPKDHAPYWGANFVLAEFDGVLKSIAPGLVRSLLPSLWNRRIPWSAVRLLAGMR